MFKQLSYFKVAPSRIFTRVGADIHSDVQLTFAQATLGDTINISGVYEEIELKVSLSLNFCSKTYLISTNFKSYKSKKQFIYQ